MFKVNGYKIISKRIWHEPREEVAPILKHVSDGRFDTICEIYIPDLEVPRFTNLSALHPNDRPNKIIGKKIALQKAMIKRWRVTVLSNGKKIRKPIYHNEFMSKIKRTEIWKAFWKWVESWENKKTIKFEGWIDSYHPMNDRNILSFELQIKCIKPTNKMCGNLVLNLGKKSEITIEAI